MKIAILGHSDLAQECLKQFTDLGAEVVHFTNKKITQSPSLKVIEGKILRVQKKFLAKNEKYQERSRLLDLFRVVYEFTPTFNEDEENSLLAKLKENKIDVDHLKEKIERFDDFDLVIDLLTDLDFPRPMGAGGTVALGEDKLKDQGRIFYGADELDAFINFVNKEDNPKLAFVIVGSGDTALAALLKLSKTKHPIHLITKEEKAFSGVKDSDFKNEYKILMRNLLNNYEIEKEAFNLDINHWKELADYEKAKVPRPAEPSFPLSLQAQSFVTTVDYLSDQNGLFLTVEKPDYIDSNSPHQSLSCSAVFVATGYEKDYSYLRSLDMKDFRLMGEEPGFYHLRGEEEITLVINDVMNFFSKVN